MEHPQLIHNQVTDTILTRRTVRSYAQQPLTPQQLQTLTQCALWAPSARNAQPCLVRLVQDKEILEQLNRDFKDTVGWDTPAYTRWDVNPVYQTAPCMFFLFSEKDAQIDAGIMVENIAIAAKGLGLDSCIIASVGALFSGAFSDKWKEILRLPKEAQFMISIAVGKGTEAPEPKPRKAGQFLQIDSLD